MADTKLGPAMTVTTAWQRQVRDELRRRAWNQSTLAERLGCSKQTVSLALQRGTKRSRVVLPTSQMLGLSPPETPIANAEAAAVLAMLDRLTDQERRLARDLIECILKNRGSDGG